MSLAGQHVVHEQVEPSGSVRVCARAVHPSFSQDSKDMTVGFLLSLVKIKRGLVVISKPHLLSFLLGHDIHL